MVCRLPNHCPAPSPSSGPAVACGRPDGVWTTPGSHWLARATNSTLAASAGLRTHMGKFTFLRHAAVYGAANMLLQAAGLVLLPLYTRFLTPRDFGALELLGRTSDVLMT